MTKRNIVRRNAVRTIAVKAILLASRKHIAIFTRHLIIVTAVNLTLNIKKSEK